MEIGKAIKYYRNKAKLTQKELAQKVNVSERTIGHYETETRTPSLDILNLIAKSLGTKVNNFLEPIPKEKKEIIFEKTWVLALDEKTGFCLSEPALDSRQGDFCSSRIHNELIYIPTHFLERIISWEETEIEQLNVQKEAEETYYAVLVDSRKKEKKRYALQIDEVMEITHYLATHDEVNRFYEDQKQKEKLIEHLSLSALSLSVDAARINSTVLYDFAHHIKALGTILKENHSKKILETKLEEIYETYKKITEEEKLEQSKTINKHVDERAIFESTLEDVLELVKQAEAKK